MWTWLSNAGRKRKFCPERHSADSALHEDVDANNMRHVHFIHFNDVYNLLPMHKKDPVGGAARFMTMVKEMKAELAPEKVILCMSGDFVGPSLTSTFTKGAHIIEAMNALGVDYATFGNHELDYGYKSLVNRLQGHDDDAQAGEGYEWLSYQKSTATWLATNMSEGNTDVPLGGEDVKRSDIVTVNGVKVGLMGISENWLPGCMQLKDGEITYQDDIETAKRYADYLKKQGAEVVVALTHSRFENDKALMAAVPGIDLALGGHDHFYKRAEKRHRVIKSGEEWRWLTHVVLSVGQSGVKKVVVDRHDVDSDVECDPIMQAIIDKYITLRDRKYCQVIWSLKHPFDATEEVCRYHESRMTNWVCDAIAEDYSPRPGLQSADFAMLMGFVFAGKQVFPAGSFKLGDLMSIFPKPCQVMVLKLKGADVVRSLERGSQFLPHECGPLHHTSAELTYKITVYQDAKNVVSEVKVNSKPIEMNKFYSVAVSRVMAKGKFGYHWMAAAERVVDEEQAMQIQDTLLMWLKRHPEPYEVPLGRITIAKGHDRPFDDLVLGA